MKHVHSWYLVALCALSTYSFAMRKNIPKEISPIERYISEKMRSSDRHNNDTHMTAILSIPNARDFQRGEAHNTVALDVSKNNMDQLVMPFDYPNLLELDCSHNKIAIFPEGLFLSSKLQHLFCSNNLINELPLKIRILQALCVLDLSFNKLKQLPDAVCDLVRLKRLSVACNALETLPKLLQALSSLELLNISSNPLKSKELTHAQNALPSCTIIVRDSLKL